MAFRIRRQESVGHGLRRLAKKEVRNARAELRRTSPPADDAIHEARKSIKKVRAILQIVEEGGGGTASGTAKRLRSVNRTLSRLRDADAMIVTLATLRKHNPHLFSEHTFARLEHRLVDQKRAASQEADDERAWKKVDRRLRKVQHAVQRWRPDRKSFRIFAKGCRSNHRGGRRAMRCALKTQRATDFHEWRKQIKTLWYALRLIEGASPHIRRDVSALHRAETALGDEHNMVVLCAELTKDASICRGPIDLDRVRVAADRYQCALRKKAIASATHIYHRTPRASARGLARTWKAWHRKRPSRRPRGQTRATA